MLSTSCGYFNEPNSLTIPHTNHAWKDCYRNYIADGVNEMLTRMSLNAWNSRVNVGQILLGTGLAPYRRAAHASWMMVLAPEVQPEPQPL